MPIRRELYVPYWDELSYRIRFLRAGGYCERCGVAHGAVGARDANGLWHSEAEIAAMSPALYGDSYPTPASRRLTTIYLTTCHWDRDPGVNGDFNLFSLCQACHLEHDRHDNWQRRRRNQQARLVAAGQLALLTERNRTK